MSHTLRGLASCCISTTTLFNRVSDADRTGIFRGPLLWLVLLLVVSGVPAFLQAQDATGKIAGVITDPSGSVVPQAKVTATNVETKISKITLTDASGFYQILSVPIGTYRVSVEVTGFSKMTSAPSALEINQTLRVDLKLEIGSVSDVVTVDAQGSRVETENVTVGGTVTGVAIAELPLNGRNTLDLLASQPGVTPTNPDSGAAGNYSIGGGRTDSVTYLLDGGLNNDLLSNGIIVNPNPDAIGEFRVLENSYGAEYGRNAGGIVSIVTKSGTNNLHGTLYDYARNTVFNANDFFNNEQGIARSVLNRQQFGGTIGGPIVIPHIVDGRNKLFFFFAYQGQRQSQLQLDGETQTYTPAEAQGDFSQAVNGGPDPNVASFLLANPYYQANPVLAGQAIIDPSKIDPIAQAYFAHGLIPTSPTGFLFPTASAVSNTNEYLGKMDFTPTAKDTISGTFSSSDGYLTSPYGNADVNGYTAASFSQTYSAILNWSHTFTPALVNQVRASVFRTTPDVRVPVGSLSAVTPSVLGINITPDIATGPPQLYFYGTGLYTGFSGGGPTTYANTVYAYYDDLSWTKGKHSLKFGFYFSPYQNNTNYAFYTNGSYAMFGPGSIGSGVDLADFLFGLPDNYFQAAQALSNIRSHQYAGYGQDQWKVSRNFTLTLGLRYEYSEPKYDTQGRSFSFVPGDQSQRFVNAPENLVYPGDPGAPKGVNFPDKTNFAPRFGFAWDVFGNAKTAVRGGFGMFYDVLKGEDNLQFNGSPPFYAEPNLYFDPVNSSTQAGPTGYLSNPFGTNNTGTPNGFPSTPPSSTVSYAPFEPFSGAIYLVDPHLKTPYVYQYSFNIQQQLPANIVAEAGYVGYDAHGLTSLVDINPFPIGTNNRIYDSINDYGYPAYGFLNEFQNIVNANYNAMQLSLNKRMGDTKIGNVFFTLAYTWSHEIDNASGFRQRNYSVPYYNHEYFRASGDTDVRSVIAFSGGWDLPFDKVWQSGPKLLTKGWSLYPIVTWRTGFPLDVGAGLSTSNTDPGPAGDGEADLVRADQVLPTVTTYNPRNNQSINGSSGNYFFNPLALSNSRALALDSQAQEDASQLIGQFTYGSFPRNALRGPGFVNVDLSLSKHFLFMEGKLDAELRLEAFNLFNHTNFGNPSTDINSSLFGQVSTTQGPRVGEIALHIRF